MYKVLIFAGTTEGIILSNLLARNHIKTYTCVATQYGTDSYETGENLVVEVGRKTQEEMEALIRKLQPEMVLDATHPYAAEVTANVKAACRNTGCSYQRILRLGSNPSQNAVFVQDASEAAEFLSHTAGNILLTTGSKELAAFTKIPDYAERIYARVLPLGSVIEACQEMQITGKHLIAMQGPFSKEMNAALLKQYDCTWMVTKESGKEGGFQEKIDAAASCGASVVIIGRPQEEEGLTLAEAKRFLLQYFQIPAKVTVLGIGMGSRETLTIEAKAALDAADILVGARRIVDAVKRDGQEVLYEYRAELIAGFVRTKFGYEHIVIALSGDVGFYSGARKLLPLLGEEVEVLPGISSVSYFMAKIGQSWDDAVLRSAHGRECNLVSEILHHEKVFAILGKKDSIAELAKKLTSYGHGEVTLYVGENLSYENECILMRKAKELTEYQGEALSVCLAVNQEVCTRKYDLSDEEFLRGKVPMTKEEIRAVSVAKLQLTKDAICYDIGAGTGSVSIEMALRAYQGKVYSVEMRREALALLAENKQKFAADAMEIVAGMAPEAMEELPAPSHAFIGGSGGNLKEIFALLLKKNPEVRIVVNCIALETQMQVFELLNYYEFETQEIVLMQASRAKELGSYHMMMGENPIYIITCQNPKRLAE